MAIKAAEITYCKECGSKDLSWFTNNVTYSGMQNGRLKTSEVTCLFVLGCDECSATLAMVRADKLADLMTAQLQEDRTAN
ncbi:hypothetical protein [Pseudomonas aeruginosa]|uniref:hypothetical protein n=1 Tax=Pseudomonas aeruginosa TaxID=287 RepID=UPI003AE27B28